MQLRPKHVLAAAVVALLSLGAAGAATAAQPPRDGTTILVKFATPRAKPPFGTEVAQLKTSMRVIKVMRGISIDQMLSIYRGLPYVVYAEPNYVAKQNMTAANDSFFGAQWALAQIHALEGWSAYPARWDATGAPIAILDTGVDATQPDLLGRVGQGADCLTGVCVAMPGTDPNGHGTVMAGIAAASANNGVGIAGVSYGSRIVPIRVLDGTGNGTYAGIAAGIVWAADAGARVINLSLGGSAPSQALCDAVSYAQTKGAVVVAAAGNSGTSDAVFPAGCAGAVGVGATGAEDAVQPWSNYGKPNLFVTAPGVGIHSTYLNGQYAIASGTSPAAALVSGLAALLFGQAPSRTPADVRGILASTSVKAGTESYQADPYGTCTGCTWSPLHGYGRIDVQRALDAALPTETSTPTTTPSTPTAPAAPTAAAANPDFALTLTSPTATVAQTQKATIPLSIAATGGFAGQVTFSVTGLPAGASASFAPASVTASGASALSVTTTAATPAGSYSLTIRATSGTLAHTSAATLHVTPPAVDFGLTVTPPSRIIKYDKVNTLTIILRMPAGVAPSAVQLSVSGLPAGVTSEIESATVPGKYTLRLDVSASAVRFTQATITVKGTLGSVARAANVAVTVL